MDRLWINTIITQCLSYFLISLFFISRSIFHFLSINYDSKNQQSASLKKIGLFVSLAHFYSCGSMLHWMRAVQWCRVFFPRGTNVTLGISHQGRGRRRKFLRFFHFSSSFNLGLPSRFPHLSINFEIVTNVF